MSAKVFADTKVLVYGYDAGEPEKQTAAQALIELYGATGDLVISTQVLQEFFVTVTRKLAQPLTTDNAYEIVQNLAEYPLVQLDKAMILSAIRRSKVDKLAFWDALIVEAVLGAGCETLFSEDMQASREIQGLTIRNPFSSDTH